MRHAFVVALLARGADVLTTLEAGMIGRWDPAGAAVVLGGGRLVLVGDQGYTLDSRRDEFVRMRRAAWLLPSRLDR